MLFDSLPPDVQQKTRRLESHITEILDGLPCDATPGQMPNPAYSVRLSLRHANSPNCPNSGNKARL